MILANSNSFEGPSFSRLNRLARLLWQIVWLLLFRPTPPLMHAWRCWLLRCFGASIAPGCHVYSEVRIWAPWNLKSQGVRRPVTLFSAQLKPLGPYRCNMGVCGPLLQGRTGTNIFYHLGGHRETPKGPMGPVNSRLDPRGPRDPGVTQGTSGDPYLTLH